MTLTPLLKDPATERRGLVIYSHTNGIFRFAQNAILLVTIPTGGGGSCYLWMYQFFLLFHLILSKLDGRFLGFFAQADIEHFDKQRERHCKVDVSFRHFDMESFDEQQETNHQ